MEAYTSFAQPSVHHHALSKNKVGLNFYHRVQRFDSDGTLAGLDPRTHLPSPNPIRKRVTFDSKVTTYEYRAVEESVELFEEKKDEKVTPLKSRQAPCSSEVSHVTSTSYGSFPPKHNYQNCRESDDEDEDVTDCDDSDDDGGLLDDYYEDKWDNEVYTEKKDEKVKPLKSRQAPCSSEVSDVTSNSSGSYPPKHNYQNCRESDDEDEHVTDCDDSDDDDGLLDDYYEDKWDNEVFTEDNVVLEIVKSNASAARDRRGNVNAVLNPIENLTQWKAVKSKGRTLETVSKGHKLNASFSPLASELSSFSIKQKSRSGNVTESNASAARDRSRNVNALLNPIENLTQWKAVKSEGRTIETVSKGHKLNASFSPLPSELSSFSIKQKSRDETKKQRTREVAVDASLSTSRTTQSFSRKPIRSGKRCSLLQIFHP